MMCRISNALEIRFSDIKLLEDDVLNQKYLLIKIPWMKTVFNMNNYKLFDLPGEDSTFVIKAYMDYINHPLFYKIKLNPLSNGYLFFVSSIQNSGFGNIIYDLNHHVNPDTVLKVLKKFTLNHTFNDRISCHRKRWRMLSSFSCSISHVIN